MPTAEFESATPESDRSQILALERSTTGSAEWNPGLPFCVAVPEPTAPPPPPSPRLLHNFIVIVFYIDFCNI